MAIRMTVKRSWPLYDLDGQCCVLVLEPATHEMERVAHPKHPCNWLVLKGTRLGASEGSWKQWTNGDLNRWGKPIHWGEFEVIVKETD